MSPLRKEGDNILKGLQYLAHMYQHEQGEYEWDWILNVLDQERQNIKFEKAEFIDMGALSHDMVFDILARSWKTILL